MHDLFQAVHTVYMYIPWVSVSPCCLKIPMTWQFMQHKVHSQNADQFVAFAHPPSVRFHTIQAKSLKRI